MEFISIQIKSDQSIHRPLFLWSIQYKGQKRATLLNTCNMTIKRLWHYPSVMNSTSQYYFPQFSNNLHDRIDKKKVALPLQNHLPYYNESHASTCIVVGFVLIKLTFSDSRMAALTGATNIFTSCINQSIKCSRQLGSPVHWYMPHSFNCTTQLNIPPSSNEVLSFQPDSNTTQKSVTICSSNVPVYMTDINALSFLGQPKSQSFCWP